MIHQTDRFFGVSDFDVKRCWLWKFVLWLLTDECLNINLLDIYDESRSASKMNARRR